MGKIRFKHIPQNKHVPPTVLSTQPYTNRNATFSVFQETPMLV